VPVNALQFSIASTANYTVGDKIMIRRPSTKEWIAELGTESFGGGISTLGWKPGDIDLYFDRTIKAIKGNEITVDAPITTALDAKYGGAFINKYVWNSRIQNIGIENILLNSSYDHSNLKDEAHRWMAITIENAADIWVRQTNFEHFAGSAVYIDASAKRTTIEDCISTKPISEIGGQRRYTFSLAVSKPLFSAV